ncbi:serine hydrolase [Mycolicibacterium neoaurum]|uniref:serine hydrolase n=1 Tax=Mycolicibacterium neoaurum TaxID=1795 RepID=UPI002672F462|nr:serine hydrolase [Mycolicibacterium neoaurum]MDO3399038.1 serine hydrolase [Mycolicibacterium neoaurum]
MFGKLSILALAGLLWVPLSPAGAEPGDIDERVQMATSEAASSGADLELAILDRDTGRLVSNGNSSFPIASVVKLFIADDALYRESTGSSTLSESDHAALDAMLRSSEDGAAQMFWDRGGRNAVIDRVTRRYGLAATTAPANGHWDVTQSTAADLVHYYDMLLNGSGGLPPEQTEIIIGNLAGFTPQGADGYPQRFGLPDGLSGTPLAVKQGWFCCWNGDNQLHVSTGIVGADRRYVLAISSLDPNGAAGARDTMTRAVRTLFPSGTP